MINHYLTTAFRNLTRSKSFSVINITGLAFGLGCSLLIFLWVLDELNVDKFHTNDKLLYRVYLRQLYDGQVQADYNSPASLPAELKKAIPEIEHATGFVKYFRLSLQDDIYESFSVADTIVHKMKGSRAEPDFFSMFSYKLLYGKPETALNSPVSLCVSRKMAEMFFGSVSAAVGKTVRFDGRRDLLVTGVFENVPLNSSDQFDYLMNWDAWVLENPFKQSWGHFGTSSYIQLRPDADPLKVEAKIKDFLRLYLTENDSWMSAKKRVELGLQPFADQYLYSTFENGTTCERTDFVCKTLYWCGGIYSSYCLYQFYEPGYSAFDKTGQGSRCAQGGRFFTLSIDLSVYGRSYFAHILRRIIVALSHRPGIAWF